MSLDGVFPLHDPVGPMSPEHQPDVDLIARLLVPMAADADRRGVHRDAIDHLAAAGLLGSPLTPASRQRELAELISGCDATTWFCWVQHQSPLRTLESATPSDQTPGVEALRSELLDGLRSGRQLAAVAFAHVRRPGPPNPVATRVDGGWRLTGTLDWVTSWDLADVVMIIAQGSGADANTLVSFFLPAGNAAEQWPGLRMDLPLALLSMGGTHTRPIQLDDVFVPADRVVAVNDRDAWLAQDAVTSANANSAAFGVARGAIAELDALARQRSDAAMRATADALISECRAVRREAYATTDNPSAPIRRRLQLRAASLDLVQRATLAVVVARAGAAMRAGHDAERRARESLFLQVQAQTAATREASLAVIADASASAAMRIANA